MKKIKAVIWDMGGVILRSEIKSHREVLAQKYTVTLEQLYDSVFNSESAVQATVGRIDEKEHWRQVGEHYKISGDELEDFQRQFWAGDRLDQELIRFIRELRPTYQTALLSNAWSGARYSLTYERPCMDAFDFSLFSYEAKLAKPDPAIYHKILSMIQVSPEEAIFVDDNLDNINAANVVGIHGIQFLNSLQARDAVNEILNTIR